MIQLIDSPVYPRTRTTPSTLPTPLLATQLVVESREHPVCGLHGEPLAAGCALEIGYFSRAQMATPFRGKWIALTGAHATQGNRSIPAPRIGSGDSLPGCFSWSHIFQHGVETLAPVNVPLAIRIYDHADPQAARGFTSVSNPSWWCRPPKAGVPALVFMSLDFDGLAWEGGPRDAFRTSLPVFGSMFSRLMALGESPLESDL